MDGVLLVVVALGACCNDFVVVGVQVPIPLAVFITFEKDEVHEFP